MRKFYFLLLISVLSCQKDQKRPIDSSPIKKAAVENSIVKDDNIINYDQFIADTLTGMKIKDFYIISSYKLNGLKVIEGYYLPVDGKIVFPDTETNYGQRFLFLNQSDEIIFTSKGQRDVYLNQPYFYKNNSNGKIIIISQLAFEYFMGGDAFLVEGKNIKYLGNIDVEGKEMETSLIDILKITETKDKIIFSFLADSIFLQPGSEDQLIKNKNHRYEYDGRSFEFK